MTIHHDPISGQLTILAIAEALIKEDTAAAKALIPAADTGELTELVCAAAGMLARSINTAAGEDHRSPADVIAVFRAWIISEGTAP